MDVPNDLDVFTLPSDYVPGSDVLSKFILRNESILDIVVKSLVGEHVSSSMYNLGQCLWTNKSVSDVVYVPKVQDLAPLLIEVQYEVDSDFIGRLMNYSFSLKDEYGQLPIVLVIATKNVTNDVTSKFINTNNHYMNRIVCDFWAKRCEILSSNSIRPYLDNDPLQKLVALGYFFTQRKRCILSVDKKHDPTVQLLYQIAKAKFQNECYVEEEKLIVIQDLCQKGSKQFRKIADCAKNGEPMKKILQYALDGELFFKSQEIKFNSQRRETTPIEDTPDISDLSTPSYQSSSIAVDGMTYVDNFISKLTGRMSWESCYSQGRESGFFANYTNFKSLKSAYNSRKSRAQKRKMCEMGE